MAERGESKYPIKPRYVLKLDKPRDRTNSRISGLVVPHYVYLWIQTEGKLLKGRQEKDRKFGVVTCYMPTLETYKGKLILNRRYIQKESIARQLKEGFSIVTENLPYWYRTKDYRKFYELLGII